jgi:hypothetical protein
LCRQFEVQLKVMDTSGRRNASAGDHGKPRSPCTLT